MGIIIYNMTFKGEYNMDKKRLEYFKAKLLKEREIQMESLKNREKEKEETIDMLDSELSSYDNHPADIGTEVYMMEQEKGFMEEIKQVVEEIDASLEQIKDGSYGTCKSCNKKIREERLELIPYAKTCLDCSGQEEEREETQDEKIYESLNYKTMDFKPKKEIDNVEYDREDAYRDLYKDDIVEDDPSFSGGDNMGIIDEDELDEADTVEDVEKISEEYYDDTLE